MIRSLLISFALLGTNCIAQSGGADGYRNIVYAFVNGNWFDGKSFIKKTFYTQNGILTSAKPHHVDSIINLTGKYIVPPFGEAHNHNVDGSDEKRFLALKNRYLKDGIFYIKNPNNVPRSTAALKNKINIPESIDVIFSNGSFTAAGGHPIEIDKRNQALKIWPAADGEGGFYYVVDDMQDFTNKWEALKKTNPDFVKTYLLYSEEFGKRKTDTGYFGWKGLNPALLKMMAKKIHQDGYKIATHVETAADFHNALVAGVDEINHMPGFRTTKGYSMGTYKIADADAKLAAQRKIIVVTTMGNIIENIFNTLDTVPGSKEKMEMVLYNFNMLKKHQVQLAIGSDEYRRNSRFEIESIARLNLFDNETLLKMWCETTSKAIFPKRRIGYLKEGYEASFLVLNGNPIKDFKNTGNINMRIKSGVLLPVF
jgi:imidazolonepropionase-like amidohydrolase